MVYVFYLNTRVLVRGALTELHGDSDKLIQGIKRFAWLGRFKVSRFAFFQ